MRGYSNKQQAVSSDVNKDYTMLLLLAVFPLFSVTAVYLLLS